MEVELPSFEFIILFGYTLIDTIDSEIDSAKVEVNQDTQFIPVLNPLLPIQLIKATGPVF